MILLFVAAFWATALWGLRSRRPVLLMLVFGTLPLGSFAVVPPSATGGLSLVASPVAILLLGIRQGFFSAGGFEEMVRLARRVRPGRLLVAFWTVAALTTAFAPRFFAGDIEVIGMSSSRPEMLQVTRQNLSQWLYLSLSVFAVFALAAFFRARAERRLIVDGVLLAAAVTVATGALDAASSALPIAWLLEPFRTARYAILDQQQFAGGTDRVIGLMPEPASFGALSVALLSMLYFLRPVISQPRKRLWANRLLLGLVAMVVLSTSAAAYGGLAVLVLVAACRWAIQPSAAVAVGGLAPRSARDIRVALSVMAVVLLALLVMPAAFDPVVDRVEVVLIDKPGTHSFEERTMWTRTAVGAGLSSSMLGVGLGSTRASNHAAVLFASTGLAGLVLYTLFVADLVRRRPTGDDAEDRLLAQAMTWSFVPVLAIDLAIATTPDFGSVQAMRWGLLLAIVAPAACLDDRRPMAMPVTGSDRRLRPRPAGRPPGVSA